MPKKALKKKDTSSTSNIKDKHLDALYQRISGHLHIARSNVLQTIDNEMVKTYWLIGRDIVEEEQHGASRAKYGQELIKSLSLRLTSEFGKGYGVSSLADMKKFYLSYPQENQDEIFHALRGKSSDPQFTQNLGWTHYRSLMRITREDARAFYEIEASKNRWSSRQLDRQIGSLLFDRLAKSKDRKGLLRLAQKGQELINPIDAIKDPVVLEFLEIPEAHQLVESKLEQALISNLQHFLLELGKGFAFVARQKRLTLDGKNYYTDLVFYHTVLKCYIIIDIKTHELTHGDLGQMLFYVNYYDQEIITPDDNPTIGLILCSEKSNGMVKYTLGEKNKKIFTSKYQFHLPTVKELEAELKREIKQIKHQLNQPGNKKNP